MSDRSTVPYPMRAASEWAARLLIIGAAVYFGMRIVGHLSELIIPVVVALLLAALFSPLTRWMSRKIPRGAAAGVTVLGTLAVLAGAFTIVGTQVSSGFGDVTTQVAEGITKIRSYIKVNLGVSDQQFTDYIDQLKKSIQNSGNIASTATSAGLTATHLLAGLFITLFSLYFFLYDGHRIWAWIVRLFPRAARDKMDSSGEIAWGQLIAFTNATVLVAATDALGISLGALALGVPFVTAIGLLVFIGAFIPIVGALISGSVAVLLALVAQGPLKALIMLGVVVLVQQIEAHALQPFLLGRAVRVHPLAVILAIAAGVLIAGIAGALVAVPIAACANAVGNHLLGAPPEPTPEDEEDDGPLAPDQVPPRDEVEEGGDRAEHRADELERKEAG